MQIQLIFWICVAHLSCGFPVQGTAVQYNIGTLYKYNYETTTLSNKASLFGSQQSKSARDVGMVLTAKVHLTAVWTAGSQMLVEVKVVNPRIISGARPDLSRDLLLLSRLPVYAQLDNGKIGRVFVGEEDTNVSIGIKKGIVSLLQLQTNEGTRTEIDTSGECLASYSIKGKHVIKTKGSCKNTEYGGQYRNVNQILDLDVTSSSESVYVIDDDVIQAVNVTERHLAAVNLEKDLAISACADQHLELLGKEKGSQTIPGNSVTEAVKNINKNADSQFYATALTTLAQNDPCKGQNCDQFTTNVSSMKDLLTSDHVATVESTAAFLSLVQTARQATKESVLEALRKEGNQDIVSVLIDIVVAAQTPEGQSALMEFIDFTQTEDISRIERYLLAVAFSPHPSENLLKELLKLHKKQIPDVRLQESIGEALGAVVYTYCQMGHCQEKIVDDIRETFLSQLSSCSDDPCVFRILRSLSNAAFPQTIPILLRYAQESNDTTINEAAIKAFRRFNQTYFTQKVHNVMIDIYHQRLRHYDTSVRSQALRIIITTNPNQEEIDDVMRSITDPYENALNSFVKNYLFNQMSEDEQLREYVKNSLKNPEINNWNILASKGKSLAFTANLTETESVIATYDMYVENSRAGLLKRSGLDVKIVSPSQTLNLYNFGIFAAGMEGLIGEEVEEGQEDIVPTAGLALDIMEVSLRPVTFFEGQAALMGAVWSAPSELTSALQANLLMLDHLSFIHHQNGLVSKLEVQGAVSTDLSGLISISLWNKNCHSLIKNSGAIVVEGSFSIDTPTFQTGVEFSAQSGSLIDFISDVDFYDKLKSCLQMTRPTTLFKQTFSKFEYIRGLKKNYRATLRQSRDIQGVSYPLPRSNDIMCKELLQEQ